MAINKVCFGFHIKTFNYYFLVKLLFINNSSVNTFIKKPFELDQKIIY